MAVCRKNIEKYWKNERRGDMKRNITYDKDFFARSIKIKHTTVYFVHFQIITFISSLI